MTDVQVAVLATLQWRRWVLPGLILCLLLTAAAIAARSGSIRADLESRGKAKLAADGQGWASVRVSGRDATVSGTAPSVAAQRLAMESAGRLFGFHNLADDTGLIPVAAPFIWTADRIREGIVIAGSAPDPETLSSLREAAKAAGQGTAISDRSTLARGAPHDFAMAAEFGLRVLSRLAVGRAEIRDSQLTIAGSVPDRAVFDTLSDELSHEAPAGYRLVLDIQPPLAIPYVWKATTEAGALSISGNVPTSATKTALAAKAGRPWGKAGISDSAVLASGAPPGFEAAAEFALAALAKLGSGEADLNGLSLRLSGRSKSVDDHDALFAMLGGTLPAGLALNSVAVSPPIVSPYFFKVEKDPSGLILSGYMPSADARKMVTSYVEASLRGNSVTSRLRIADGAPKIDWVGAAKFAVDRIRKITRGSSAVTGQTYDLSGEAATSEAFAELRGAASGVLPASLKLGKLNIAPPAISPYWIAAAAGSGKLLLEGYVPSEEARDALVATSKRKFGRIEIVDRLGFASGQPADFDPAMEASLQALSRLASGRMEIKGTAVTLAGGAPYPGAAERVESEFSRGLPRSFRANTQLTSLGDGEVLAAAGCNAAGKAILSAAKIDFLAGSATLLADSYGTLDRLTAVLRRCPQAKVEIGSHTDSDGTPSSNLTLSKARAEAVVSYLASSGILRERLFPVGYGETRPIASNGTEEGRAQNRRVEISVQE